MIQASAAAHRAPPLLPAGAARPRDPALEIAERELQRALAGRRRRQRWTLLGLAGLAVITLVVSVGVGAYAIPAGEVATTLWGLLTGQAPDTPSARLLASIRLPRAVSGLLVGASLGSAGALLQGLVRNPLAEPGLLGVSAGAALGAALALVAFADLAPVASSSLAVPAFAFVGALLATALVMRFGRTRGRADIATLILAGIAINALCGAGTGLFTALATDAQLRSLTFWMLGSLNGAGWTAAGIIAGGLLPLLLAAPWLARQLDAMALGEGEARQLGVPVARVHLLVCALAALAVASAVSMVGAIGFIGLLAPHLVRLLAGPYHRALLWGSALSGATLLLAADSLSRVVIAPSELPIGIITAFLGAPFLLWLAHRQGGARE